MENTQGQGLSPNLVNDTNVNVVPQELPKKMITVGTLLLILFFLLLLSSLLYYFLFYKQDSALEKEEEIVLEKPEGEIYLTLSPLGTEKPNIYKLDLESMELEEFFPNSPYRNYMAKISPDLDNMVFVRAYEDDTSQVLVLNESTGEITELTEKSPYFYRNPTFSPDGTKVVYWVYESDDDFFSELPEGSNIYVIDFSSGTQEQIAQGAFPLFSLNNASILFMKNEGFYSFNLATGEELEVLLFEEGLLEALSELEVGESEFEIGSWLNFRTNVCYPESLLIITNTSGSTVNFGRIQSWETFETELFEFSEFYFPNWPIFSPDCKYFAMQDFELYLDSQAPQFTRFSVFRFEDLVKAGALILDEFELDYIWITDWIVR